MMRRLKRLLSRPGRKAGLAHYVRLSHKFSKRLGLARFRARNAERELERVTELHRQQFTQLYGELSELRLSHGKLATRVSEYEAAEKARATYRSPVKPYPPGVAL